MKALYFILLVILPLMGWGQPEVSHSIQVLTEDKVSQISDYLDKTISLTINNQESTYSQKQATKVLGNFFSKNKITGFQVAYKNDDNQTGSIYIIGKLASKRQPSGFTIYLFYARINHNFRIREIRIE